MPNIEIYNASSHDQSFEVHGFNNSQNVTVKGHAISIIPCPGPVKSGAVIALHEGHEGEQAEITFNGWGDLEWYDISVIVGAGGNLTIEQVGNPGSRKGDPTFMQDLRSHYARADSNTKAALRNCVHLDSHGQVERIDAPKDFPALESFVRTFAEDKLYIGVGAWQGSKGDAGDNDQSSGTKGGNKDVRITYSDGDTPSGAHEKFAISTAPPKAAELDHRAPALNGDAGKGGVQTDEESPVFDSGVGANGTPVNDTTTNSNPNINITPDTPAAEDTAKTNGVGISQAPIQFPSRNVKAVASPFSGDPDHGGPGIVLSNKSSHECTYFFFNNYWNGNGTAGANFDHPDRSISLRPHTSAFIGLAESFKGRVQRGKFIPATWVEFQLAAANNTGAWGDISLEQGYDGPAMIRSLDGSNYGNGFDRDILPGAPASAVAERAQDKVKVLASTMGNWLGGPNKAAIEYEQKVVGQKSVYITGGEGTNVVNSRNKRMAVDMY